MSKILKTLKKAGKISHKTLEKILKEAKPDEIEINAKGQIIIRYYGE